MILSDNQISDLCFGVVSPLLDPFEPDCLNSYGYDIRLGYRFLLTDLSKIDAPVDPFDPPGAELVEVENYLVIPAGSSVLGEAIEKVAMPRNLTGICVGRSTYARAGIVPYVTPIEAGWVGRLTIEIHNVNRYHSVMVHCGKAFLQVMFLRGDKPPLFDYGERSGRYQDQKGVSLGLPDAVPLSSSTLYTPLLGRTTPPREMR